MRTGANGLPVLDQFSEEGFVDTVFQITRREDTPTHYILRLQASYAGQIVGVTAELVRGIQSGFDADMHLVKEHVYPGGVTFRSAGSESDRLLCALAELYGAVAGPRSMVAMERFTAIALQKGALNVEADPVKLKLFGRDGSADSEDDYYESFFNLDLAGEFVYWNEKDQDYREPLIRALSA